MSRIYLWGNLYYADKVEVKSRLIETDGAQTAQAKIRRLADTVRQTAHAPRIVYRNFNLPL